MTNDQLAKSGANIVLFPAIVFLFCVGLFLLYDFWSKEAVSRELTSFVAVEADDYTLVRDARTTTLSYTYSVGEKTYQSSDFSPYSALNKVAKYSVQVRALTTRTTSSTLMVYYDPQDPARVSILRAWPREGRLGGASLGGICVWVGCLLLARLVRRVPRQDLLFQGR